MIWRLLFMAALVLSIFFGTHKKVSAQLSCGFKQYTSAYRLGCIGGGTAGGGGGGGGACSNILDYSQSCNDIYAYNLGLG